MKKLATTGPGRISHCEEMVGGKIIQANLQKSLVETNCLIQDLLDQKSPTVTLVQEPYVGNSKEPKGIPSMFECHYGGDHPRAAIVTHQRGLLLCPSYSGKDITTCQLPQEDGKEVYLVSMYCDILYQQVPKEATKLLEENTEANVIIGMDSNAHSPMWGCEDTNKRGEMIEEFIVSNNLVVCNQGSKFTFMTTRAKSIIDLTLCSRDMVTRIRNWKVNETHHFSDHRRITFWMNMEPTPQTRGWALKSADWGMFKQRMGERSGRFKPHNYWT